MATIVPSISTLVSLFVQSDGMMKSFVGSPVDDGSVTLVNWPDV